MASTNEDPVAAKSSFLSTYMNTHADTLLAYIMQKEGSKAASATDMKMQSISSKEMILSWKSGSKQQQTTIAFDPPLAGFEEVRPRLLAMKTDAETAIGIDNASRPTLLTYKFPTKAWITAALLIWLIYTSIPLTSTYFSPAFLRPAAQIRAYTGGWRTIKFAWTFVAVAHSLEAVYHWTLCTRHKTPLPVKLAYTATTFAFGVPSISGYNSRIQRARIANLRKAH